MTNIKRVGDLEINQDLEFQKLAWRIQRIGWIVLTLIVLAAMLGLFGEGPLSSARAGNQFEIMDQEASPSIIFFMSPDVIGSLHATVELEDGASINFRQFVYP